MKTLLSYFLFLLILPAFSAELVLAENGSAKAGIVIPEKAKPIVRFAARELKAHLDAMTGADFPIGTETDKPCSIRLGNSLPPMNMSSVQKGKTSASMDATATRKRTCSAFSMMIRTKEHLRASTDFWILSVCAGPRPEPVRFRNGKESRFRKGKDISNLYSASVKSSERGISRACIPMPENMSGA